MGHGSYEAYKCPASKNCMFIIKKVQRKNYTHPILPFGLTKCEENHCVCKLISVHQCAFVSTIIVYIILGITSLTFE
jgi:hypothetical protein